MILIWICDSKAEMESPCKAGAVILQGWCAHEVGVISAVLGCRTRQMAAGGRRRAAPQRRRGDPVRPSASPAAPPSVACSDTLCLRLPLPPLAR